MNQIFAHLKPRAPEANQGTAITSDEVERTIGIILPKDLLALLKEIKGAVIFEEDIRFKPSQPSGREYPEGYLDLEILYGLSTDDNGIPQRYLTFKDQLPSDLIAIGESPGGDQICLSRTTPQVYFWKHDVEDDEAVTEIAPSFSAFASQLVANPDIPETERLLRSKKRPVSWRFDF